MKINCIQKLEAKIEEQNNEIQMLRKMLDNLIKELYHKANIEINLEGYDE